MPPVRRAKPKMIKTHRVPTLIKTLSAADFTVIVDSIYSLPISDSASVTRELIITIRHELIVWRLWFNKDQWVCNYDLWLIANLANLFQW